LAILSDDIFDAMSLDPTTLTFGRTGDEDSLAFCNGSPGELALPLHIDRSPNSCIDLHCVHPCGIPRNTPPPVGFVRFVPGGLFLLRQDPPPKAAGLV
jgi:hypothetical protein